MNLISASHRQFFATALTAALVILGGWQVAWWGWHFLTPRLKNAPFASKAAAVDIAEGRQLFGDAGSTADTPIAAGSAAIGIRLKGVFAVDGRALSAAVINLGARDVAVARGETIASGVTLSEIHAGHIIISRAGVRERIDLDRYDARAGKSSPSAAAPAVTQLRLNVTASSNNNYTLSRQELNGVLQDSRQWSLTGRIANAPNGGVRVEESPTGSLPDKLGIKPGDIITGINGQPVSAQGDLVRLYQQFGSMATIRVEVKRGGAPVVLSYSIQN